MDDLERLIKKLNSNNLAVRRSAADALRQIGTPAVVTLLELLNDTKEIVVQSAAYALGRIGDPRAVEPLMKKLGDKDQEVRLFAGYALDEIGDAERRQIADTLPSPDRVVSSMDQGDVSPGETKDAGEYD